MIYGDIQTTTCKLQEIRVRPIFYHSTAYTDMHAVHTD